MTYYLLLGVPFTATMDQIRKAYRKKAFQFHPDRNKNPNAHQQFIAIRMAYETLSDANKRAKYDAKLGMNEFSTTAPKESSIEENEYFNNIYYDPIEEWVNCYRMSWKEWFTIPALIKLKKVTAEIIFRLLYALLGVGLFLLISDFIIGPRWMLFKAMQIKSVHSMYYFGMTCMAATFFIFAKGIGNIFKIYKRED